MANGISGRFSSAESRNRGCIFTGVLIQPETYYDRACNAALGARVIWYICFAYRTASERANERDGRGERERGGKEGRYERDREERWWRCASRTSVLAFHNKVQTRGNASNSVTGVFADSTCPYLSRRYSTNYVCLLSNAQFVCASTEPGRVILTTLSISKDLVILHRYIVISRTCKMKIIQKFFHFFNQYTRECFFFFNLKWNFILKKI